MKNYFLLLVVLLFSLAGFSQTDCPEVRFTYDASGNRVARQLVVVPCPPPMRLMSTSAPTVKDSIPPMMVNAYPNPAQDRINVEIQKGEKDEPTQVYLYSTDGRILHSETAANNRLEINVVSLAVGTYLLKVVRGEKQVMYQVYKN